MAGLLDFFQGASNAAASNISAPVDGLAWLLKKAGIDIEKPVGGSDWMESKGLTRKPENKWAGLLGESVGGLAPIIAAAKAPQIAKGLLQGADNLVAPRTMNPQTGAIVWHGSPHKFDKFDASKIGTGEGAQAYGHGLYLAESDDVAKSYIASNSNSSNANYIHKGKPIDPNNEVKRSAAFNLMAEKGDKEAIYKQYKPSYWDTKSGKEFKREVEKLDYAKLQPAGSLYKIDLPDEHIAKMLDWDKPISQQSKEVQQAIKDYDALGGKGVYHPDATGQQIYNRIGESANLKDAAETLRWSGIPGIRYLDGGSRGAGAGSSNYVVFPGNEGLLSILERNGQSLK